MTIPATAQAQADRLREEARVHKKNSAIERRLSREKMQELARFVAECEQHDIIVILERPQSQRGQSGSNSSRDT